MPTQNAAYWSPRLQVPAGWVQLADTLVYVPVVPA
jgi:hypothetical protein